VASCLIVLGACAAPRTSRPETAAGWRTYVAAAEARIARERGQAIPRRPGVARGAIDVVPVSAPGPNGDLDVPAPACTTGAAPCSLPGARLDEMIARLEREPPDTTQEDVVSSAILRQRPGWLKVAIRRAPLAHHVGRLRHGARAMFERHAAARASSWSTATKIVEIADAGTPKEHPKPEARTAICSGDGNAYWRYEQVAEGVLVECESVTLSRAVPLLLRPVAGPS